MTSLYFATPLAFNSPDGGVRWNDLRKILQRMAKVRNGEEILPKVSTPSRDTNVTDDRWICDSKDPNIT